MRRFGPSFIASAALAAAVALAACTTENTTSTEGTPPPGDAFVEVRLDEFSIELPATIPAGTISFEIANAGEMDHSFAIQGPGIEDGDQLESPVAPTGTFTYTAELQPGTYTVWCPIGDHRDRGMEATIEVTESDASPGSDGLGEEAITPSEQEAPITDDYSAP